MLTTYASNILLNLAFGGTTWPGGQPGTLYFGLFTAAPTVAGGGTEVSAGGYARVGVTANGSNFTAISTEGDPLVSAVAVTFPAATAAWGTVLHMGIFDASSGGNLLCFAPVTPRAIAVNDVPSWAAGALSFDSSGHLGKYLQKQLLNYLFTGASFTSIATHYLALGTGGTEAGLSGESAAASHRKSITNNTSNWPAAASSVKSLGAAADFTTSPGAGTWTHAALYDSATTAGGNMLALIPLTQAVVTLAGELPTVASSSLTLSLNA